MYIVRLGADNELLLSVGGDTIEVAGDVIMVATTIPQVWNQLVTAIASTLPIPEDQVTLVLRQWAEMIGPSMVSPN